MHQLLSDGGYGFFLDMASFARAAHGLLWRIVALNALFPTPGTSIGFLGTGKFSRSALIAGPVLGYTVRGRKRDGRFHGGGRRTEDGDDLQRRVDVDIVSVLNVEFDQQAAQWYTELG